MADFLMKLPLEILFMVLQELPVQALLAFGATSRENYVLHTHCVRGIQLAVFHKRLHARIALLNIDMMRKPGGKRNSSGLVYSMPITLQNKAIEREASEYRLLSKVALASTHRQSGWSKRQIRTGFIPTEAQTVRAQNHILSKTVGRYGFSLRTLEFMANDLNEEGAVALGSACGDNLEHLGLRFEHPHIRDMSLSRSYWSNPPLGSPAWNALIGVGKVGKDVGLKNLRSLLLERASITPWQLQMLVKRNPNLKDLRLRTCSAVQPEFLDWLGGEGSISKRTRSQTQDGRACPGASIEVLWLENCHGLVAKRMKPLPTSENENEYSYPGLDWVKNLKNLKSLSFRECINVNAQIVETANETTWHVAEVLLPHPLIVKPFETIEVDPEYMYYD